MMLFFEREKGKKTVNVGKMSDINVLLSPSGCR